MNIFEPNLDDYNSSSVRKEEAKREQNYKDQSLKAGRDLRFHKPKKEFKKITEEEFYKRIEAKL